MEHDGSPMDLEVDEAVYFQTQVDYDLEWVILGYVDAIFGQSHVLGRWRQISCDISVVVESLIYSILQ